MEEGEDLRVKGDLLDHEYEIRRDGRTVASVSKKWFTLTDTYGITVDAGEDEGLILGRGGSGRDGERSQRGKMIQFIHRLVSFPH